MDTIIEHLRQQSGAFQDSFKILSHARNLGELAKYFFNVLHDNLQVEKAIILFKQKEKKDWQVLFLKENQDFNYHHLLNHENEFNVIQIDHPVFKISIYHPLSDKSAFKIFLGKKLDKSVFSELDKIILQLFLLQLGSAYQFYIARIKEKKLIFDLNHRLLQLNSLIDTSIEISRLQESGQLLNLALERVLALTNASKGMLRVKMGNKVLEKIFFPHPFKSKKLENEKHKISASFRFDNKVYTFYLFEKESREGVVSFDEVDKLLLDAFARQVHVSLENNYLYKQSLEKERIDYEISIAGAIQKNLIPKDLPKIANYDLWGVNIPTKHVGGDYYDCIPLEDDRYMFIMADVSGKGVAAALLVSTLHASVHAYLKSPFELKHLVQQLNEVIYEASTIDKYITAVFALFDPKNGSFLVVNAGHNPTYILRKDKSLEEMKTGGVPLGMVPMDVYESTKTVLKPGDGVLFYTDGVTEAKNEKGEDYDDINPLGNFLVSQKASSAKNIINELIADLRNFTGDTPQSDDITALYLARNDI